jgi:hypothetical protein
MGDRLLPPHEFPDMAFPSQIGVASSTQAAPPKQTGEKKTADNCGFFRPRACKSQIAMDGFVEHD